MRPLVVLVGLKESGTDGTTADRAASEGTKADWEVPDCTKAAAVASLELDKLSEFGEFAMISMIPGIFHKTGGYSDN